MQRVSPSFPESVQDASAPDRTVRVTVSDGRSLLCPVGATDDDLRFQFSLPQAPADGTRTRRNTHGLLTDPAGNVKYAVWGADYTFWLPGVQPSRGEGTD